MAYATVRFDITGAGTHDLNFWVDGPPTVTAVLQRRILIEGDVQFLAIVATVLAGNAFPEHARPALEDRICRSRRTQRFGGPSSVCPIARLIEEVAW